MFCPKCGNEVDSKAVFCKKCGYQLKVEAKTDKKKSDVKKRITAGIIFVIIIVAAIAGGGFYILKVQPEKKYDVVLETGQKYMEEELYEQAIASYKEAIRIAPKQIAPYRNLANAYLALNDVENLEATYDDVIEVITDTYKDESELSEEATDVYKDVIKHYGEKGDIDKVGDLSDEVINMLDKEEEKEEFEDLKKFYQMNWAYYNKLLEKQEKYGEGEKLFSIDNAGDYLTGLCFAKLVDMNGDQQDELILIYGDPENAESSNTTPVYIEEVWQYQDGQIQEIYQGSALEYNDAMQATSYIINQNNQYYITVGRVGYLDKYEIWGFEENQFVIIKTLEADPYLNYKMDDVLISKDEYETERDIWTNKDSEYNLSTGSDGLDKTLQEKENTFSILQKRLNINKKNNLEDANGKTQISIRIPQNAVEYNGHHYYIYEIDDITSGEDAEKYCESLGGYLATITSADENEFLFNYIHELGYENAHFGFTDSEEEGTWKWVTGEEVDYTNWHSGEPNGENEDEDYAMFYFKYDDGTWNDGDFNGRTVNGGNAFICEWGDVR